MATVEQFRRGSSTTRLGIVLAAGEAYFDTSVFSWFVGDGATLGGLQVANALVTSVSGATHTINAEDAGKFFVYTNAAGCAVSLAEAGSSGGTYFPGTTGFWAVNIAAGTVTITPAVSTINGLASLALGPGDGCVVVSNGGNYLALVARQTISATASFAGHVVGNTTGQSSTSTLSLTNQTWSATGGLSMGYSAGTLIFSGATSQTSEGVTALGNTTASSSSTTKALAGFAVSATGNISAGWSGTTLVLSASAPAGATSQGRIAIGNTTAATSSISGSITNQQFSGAGIVSVGFTTTGAGSDAVMVISAAAGGGASSIGAVATGNTTGASSSSQLTQSNFIVSGAGAASVGFATTGGADGALIISVPLGAAPYTGSFLQNYDPYMAGTSLSSNTGGGIMALGTIQAPHAVTFNQVQMFGSYLLTAASVVVTTAGTATDTITASGGFTATQTQALYTGANATSYTLAASTSGSYAFNEAVTVNRNSNSVTFSAIGSWIFYTGSGAQSTVTASVSASSAGNATFTLVPDVAIGNRSSSFVGNWIGNIVPWATSVDVGLHMVGQMSTTGNATATQASNITIVAPTWSCAFMAPINNLAGPRPSPGVPGAVAFGVGITTSVGSVVPTSAPLTGLSLNAGNVREVYSRFFIGP